MKKKAIKIIEENKKDEELKKPEKDRRTKSPFPPKIKKLYMMKYLVQAEGEDAKNFDFVAERPPGNKAELFEATLHLISESLGPCLVCLNELYINNGFISSLVSNLFLACLMSYCLYSLARSAHTVYGVTKVPLMTYPDLAQASMDISTYPILRKYGGKFKYTVIAAIVVRLCAKCCVYQLVMARSIDHLFKNETCDDSAKNMRKYLASLMLPCILICMLTNLDYTGPFSFVFKAFMAILYIYIMCMGMPRLPSTFDTSKIFISKTSFFAFWGGCVFTMDTTCAILSVENTMNTPKKIYLVIIIGMSVVSVLVMSMGIVGGFGWGSKAIAPVLVNFVGIPYSSYFRTALCLAAYSSFALDFWVLFNLVWVNLKFRHAPETHWIFERLYRAGFVLAITMLGMLCPDLSGIMSLFGSLAGGSLNFIFPPMIEFLVSTRKTGLGKLKWKLLRLAAIATVGWILIIGGSVSGLLKILLKVYVDNV